MKLLRIINLEDLADLHGFVGTLLVLLSGAGLHFSAVTVSMFVFFFFFGGCGGGGGSLGLSYLRSEPENVWGNAAIMLHL